MHIFSKDSKNDLRLVIENTNFFEAIRRFDYFVEQAFEDYKDKKLIASFQVIGYEVVKVVFSEKQNAYLEVAIDVDSNGTELSFIFEKEFYEQVCLTFNESGYFRNKVEYICDNYFFDKDNYTLVCSIDVNSNNRQLSLDRINMLNKYLKKEEATQKRFHDTL